MTHYRELTYDEKVTLAREILDANENRNIHEFIVNIYGEGRAHLVSIEIEADKYGPEVCAVRVYDEQAHELLPDFSLPYWQDMEGYLNEFSSEAQLEEVYSHLRNDSVYLEYAIPAEDIEGLVLSQLSLVVEKKIFVGE